MTVSFPAMSLEFEISRVAFTLFGVPIYWYGLIIAMGFIAGITLATMVAKKLGEQSDLVLDVVLWCAPVAIVCARLYYVIFKWEDYSGNLLEIFDIRSGGLAIYGGIIGGIIAAFLFCNIKKKKTLKVFDICSVGLITGQMIGRWGNFFNQEAFGSNTNLPWGMTSAAVREYLHSLALEGYDINPEMPVHPTFLYESLWCLATMLILLVLAYKFYRYNGQIFFAYTALYGLGRFWIEGLRTDSLMIGMFRVSQLIALAFFLVCSFAYVYFLKKNQKISKN